MIYLTDNSYWQSNYFWYYLQSHPQQNKWLYPNYQTLNYCQLSPVFGQADIYSPKMPQLEQNQQIQVDLLNQQEEQSNNLFRPTSTMKYVKKNAESNVINRIFSYLSMRSKSQSIVGNIFKGNIEKSNIYYEVMKEIRKKNKKYINRCYIKQLMALLPNHLGFKLIQNSDRKDVLGIEEMKRTIRVLIIYYMKVSYVSSILTSKKLDKDTIHEHLQRGKCVLSYLTNQIKINQP